MSPKKNEILPSATTWRELKSIMLGEISQRTIYHMISLMWNLKKQMSKGKKKDKPRNTLNHRKQTDRYQSGGWGWVKLEVRVKEYMHQD